jgi:hypothetical protein
MEEWKVPGLAVAVVQNGELALAGAYGLDELVLHQPNGSFVSRRAQVAALLWTMSECGSGLNRNPCPLRRDDHFVLITSTCSA